MGISTADRKRLWGLAHNMCAFPQCSQVLIETQSDAATGDSFQSVVGQEAHIRSARGKGPRHDPRYSIAKLNTYENLILLCPGHHIRIDAEGGRAFDVETLLEMKARHEKQEALREGVDVAIRGYLGNRYRADDQVLFRQARLDGPSVDSMFVDVPFACRNSAPPADFLASIAAAHPGDVVAEPGFVVTGAAQALLHPGWLGSALILGGPGQGKSTLLQYVCQFHRARLLRRDAYSGEAQALRPVTEVIRIPIRLDLRDYAQWAREGVGDRGQARQGRRAWPPLGVYIAEDIARRSGGHRFTLEHLSSLVANRPVLLALDGLDEVANVEDRALVADEVLNTASALNASARNLVVLVASRPGDLRSQAWASAGFPAFHLQRLSVGLRIQYLNQWLQVADLGEKESWKLRTTFLEHEHLPHMRDLAAYPMQLAILLHLLQRRGLLPQQRTQLYSGYIEAFLDREQSEDKEPLLSEDRELIEDIHAFLAWHLQTSAELGESSGSLSRVELGRLVHQHLDGRPKGQEFAERLLRAMEGRVLCLVEREPGYFQFEVQSLREYFAAKYVQDYADVRGERSPRVTCFEAMLIRPYWLNVCRFFVGMLNKIEVRGIASTLRQLSENGDESLPLHLRFAACRFLDDRAFQGQPSRVLTEIVEFILSGPGFALANDGLLDESGNPLALSDGAGRLQVEVAAKLALADPDGDAARRLVVADVLLRHTQASEVAVWWAGQFRPAPDWLRIASKVGACDTRLLPADTSLARAIEATDFPDVWTSELLAADGYDGSDDDVLALCITELNSGAGEVMAAGGNTPLGQLLRAAHLAQHRAVRGASGEETLRRVRRRGPTPRWVSMVSESRELQSQPPSHADSQYWRARLELVSRLWGDGWVLRQAVARLPWDVDLATLAVLTRRDIVLTGMLERELDGHRHRASLLESADGEAAWWIAALETRSSADPWWLCSVLTRASAGAIEQIADKIDAVAERLSRREYRTLEAGIRALSAAPMARRIELRDALRLNRLQLGPASLWLLRGIATDGTIERIDADLAGAPDSTLIARALHTDELVRVLTKRRAIAVSALKGTRQAMPPGWPAEGVRLRAMSARDADSVMSHPEDWPSTVVELAAARLRNKSAPQPPMSAVASADNWFN